LFEPNVSANPLSAQIFVRSGAGEFTSSGAVTIPAGTQTAVSIPIGAIPTESMITGFGIEFFSGLFSSENNAMVTATTAPQPPDFVDTVLWSFEGPNGAGSLEGWGPSFQPDHVHSVVQTGATRGMHAMQVVRTYTGEDFPAGSGNITFRWGSDITLDADAGPAADGDYNDNGTVDAADYAAWRNALGTAATLPNDLTPGSVDQDDYGVWRANFGAAGGADPAVQMRVEEVINAINNGDEIAFDVTFENRDNFPEPSPSFVIFHMFLQDGSGGFWQWDQLNFPIPAVGESATVTASVPLSEFTDRGGSMMPPLSEGILDPANGFFRMGIASNANAGHTFQIDNIRVRTAVPAGLGSAVPEPSTTLLAAAWVAVAAIGRRSRVPTACSRRAAFICRV
jgi:hypothetical protein